MAPILEELPVTLYWYDVRIPLAVVIVVVLLFRTTVYEGLLQVHGGATEFGASEHTQSAADPVLGSTQPDGKSAPFACMGANIAPTASIAVNDKKDALVRMMASR
jgi:hypothetical protein